MREVGAQHDESKVRRLSGRQSLHLAFSRLKPLLVNQSLTLRIDQLVRRSDRTVANAGCGRDVFRRLAIAHEV